MLFNEFNVVQCWFMLFNAFHVVSCCLMRLMRNTSLYDLKLKQGLAFSNAQIRQHVMASPYIDNASILVCNPLF